MISWMAIEYRPVLSALAGLSGCSSMVPRAYARGYVLPPAGWLCGDFQQRSIDASGCVPRSGAALQAASGGDRH